jgi:hypothetical protein
MAMVGKTWQGKLLMLCARKQEKDETRSLYCIIEKDILIPLAIFSCAVSCSEGTLTKYLRFQFIRRKGLFWLMV